METSLQFADRKAELEERLHGLEREKTGLLAEIPVLKERLTTLQLEEQAKTLESEVAILKDEKNSLEQQIATYVRPPTGELPAPPADPASPISTSMPG